MVNFLAFERIQCNENMFLFTSPISVHKARMNILDERIIVEHDVDCVLPGVFDIHERAAAIKFIESLFSVFSYNSEMLQQAYRDGRDARFAGYEDDINPHLEMPHMRDMWYKGWDDAGEHLIYVKSA